MEQEKFPIWKNILLKNQLPAFPSMNYFSKTIPTKFLFYKLILKVTILKL